MSQESQATSSCSSSSIESLRGRAYPACVRKFAKGPVSAIFPQFSFGIGSGESVAEASQDAEYILSAGLAYIVESGDEVPEPASAEVAKSLLEEWGLSNEGLESESWVLVEVKPEMLAGD